MDSTGAASRRAIESLAGTSRGLSSTRKHRDRRHERRGTGSAQVDADLGEDGAIAGAGDEVGETLLEAHAESERGRRQGELGAGGEAEAGATDGRVVAAIGEAQ